MDPLPARNAPKKSSIEHRVAGDARELGELQKIGPSTHPSRRRRSKRHRHRHRGRSSAVLSRWLILVFCVIGLGFLGAVVWTLVQQRKSILPSLAGSAIDVSPEALPALSGERALDMARRLLDATSASELELLLRPGEVDTRDALHLLADIRRHAPEHIEPEWLGPSQCEVANLQRACVRYGTSDIRLIAFTPDEGGRWEIDFDAFSRHCDPPFAEVAANRTDEALIRGVVSRDYYFNNLYANDAEWACYLIRSTDTEDGQMITAYCPRSSATEAAIERVENRNRHHLDDLMALGRVRSQQMLERVPFRMTLRIRHEEGAEPRQWRITEAVADDWVIGKRTLEEVMKSAPAATGS
ncbi:hypothetical protein [Haloferula sargassicola]|uniref:Uncharacterized protein n=1 Tax=Haloferula sargassicola TaxID=490096 RepID=A0ABP9US31_9BACT